MLSQKFKPSYTQFKQLSKTSYLRAGKHAKLLCYFCFLHKPSYRIAQVTLAKPYNIGCDEVTILIFGCWQAPEPC